MKRRLFAATALGSAIAIAGCTTAATSASVQSVFASIQFVLPLLDVLALGIAVAVPSSAPALVGVTPYLNSAAGVFQTLSATMTQVEAQPIVKQIEAYVASAVAAVKGVVTAPGAAPALVAFQPKVAQAEAVVALLTAFVNGVTAQPGATAARTAMPALLHR